LNIDYNEVTVARRVYRSGESEYLINGTSCRLKDVNELFYDTGIGKEGYSIIGQGQIERILNGRPEERRELFDEAAGIVKYKRRKATAQKKLENERQNLVRVNDILGELEKQVGPLERQAEKAKDYLKKREELKKYDVTMFLMEMEHVQEQLKVLSENEKIIEKDLMESRSSYENTKAEYQQLEQNMEQKDASIVSIREKIGNTTIQKGNLEGQINVLKEQIHTAEQSEEHFKVRQEAIHKDLSFRLEQKATYEAEQETSKTRITAIEQEKKKIMERFHQIQEEINSCTQGIEDGKNEMIELLNQKASTKARQQRYDTMLEQMNIRKSQLGKRLLEQKSEEDELQSVLEQYQQHYQQAKAEYEGLLEQEQKLEEKRSQWQEKQSETIGLLEQDTGNYHRQKSRLDSLLNMAERYDGYGNAIRKVMEKKDITPGVLGVVADILTVEKKYEIAIETALGGSIQNIVTQDEATAKEMIGYLKQNRLGRATFLPLTSVGKKEIPVNRQVLKEPGVLGIGSDLIKAAPQFDGLKRYLLGRTYVVDQIDHAASLARKYQYSLRIVTLEGESLNPGGSMSGGAFKNTSNLLGRKSEIEHLEQEIEKLNTSKQKNQSRLEEITTARELLKEDLQQLREDLKQAMLTANTAKINVQRAREQWDENDNRFSGLQRESQEIESQQKEIRENQKEIAEEIANAQEREQEIEVENNSLQQLLESQNKMLAESQKEVSGVTVEEANLIQSAEFIKQNRTRVRGEITKLEEEMQKAQQEKEESKTDIEQKCHEIEDMQKSIECLNALEVKLSQELVESQKKKEEMSLQYKTFFQKQEELSKRSNNLDKESYRLNSQKEKLNDSIESLTNYMWEEYELTLHNAMELRDDISDNPTKIKGCIARIKDEIRKLGDVNVNSIEEYKNVSKRYLFLKTQHDDLITAEETLLGIIEELDIGMRKQFMEKFAQIQTEFDKVFKELFGGGKGTLELVEEEDILECGIRIVAQPPGKKLQNMMQLSGGEKSLTAISLLFAIQNLKPSPFCLLDEIEAALDDSNVGRFAGYLHKLTKHTQFIVITHRRGTMAAADRLYGITMQEKGVSTLVSVNLIEDELEK
ncbi:MAG: chromosome segregation protein SMC, partial [Lachnospiraceae bacterium]